MLSRLVLAPLLLAALTNCEATRKPTVTATLGSPSSAEEMVRALQSPGSLEWQKHRAAEWQVPLAGLLNLDHPAAVAAGLEDRSEPIEIYVYALTHPTHGTYLVDSGVSERFRGDPGSAGISPLVNAVMGFDTLKLLKTTHEIIEPVTDLRGVFLTHIHLDHILGLTDLEAEVSVYIGPGDAKLKGVTHAFSRGTTDRLLSVQANLREWRFGKDGVIDVFGDGSFFAFHAPGHTPGTTAYFANTTTGVQVILGDVSHTQWGWRNQVEPGSFSYDMARSARSLAAVKQVANQLDNATVHPGHQPP